MVTGCKKNLLQSFKDNGLNIQSNQIGSVLNLHFLNEPVTRSKQVLRSPEKLHALMHLSLLDKNIFAIPRGLFILSTIMKESQIDDLTNKIDETLKELLPLIEKEYNHLLL